MITNKLRIAFVKFGGLSAGGTERWLQMMAASLPRDQFEVDYFYCDAAPYVGSDYKHADTDPHRLQYMKDHGVSLVKFHVGAKDITKPTHDWVDTDFWKQFDASRYDFVQTAKAGPAEYPYYLMKLPVIEYVTLAAGVDFSPSIVCSIHLSQWQRSRWLQWGGTIKKSSVIPIPAEDPSSSESLRAELNIPAHAVVAGFHQRNDDNIFSPIPLAAFARLQTQNHYFVLMGGGDRYRQQAQELHLANVRFLDHSGDARHISKFLNTLDIFAHGRRDGETFGTVLAEAMMHGKPCLSHYSRKGANAQPETMGPGGLFARNEVEYYEFLQNLFIDEGLRHRLGTKAQSHAQTYYSLESCVAQLGNCYRRLKGTFLSEIPSQRLGYGYSPLGFLYAGHLENPDSVAHHVLTGEIPDEANLNVLRYFLPQIKTFIAIGADSALYAFVAAKECPPDAKVYIYEPQTDDYDAMSKTVWLNNWEDRVAILPINIGKTNTFDHQMETQGLTFIDFIKIDVAHREQEILEGATKIIERDSPVLFIRKTDNTGLEWLSRQGYEVLFFGHASYLCLHKVKHRQAIQNIPSWTRSHERRARFRKFAKGARRSIGNAKRTASQFVRTFKKLPQMSGNPRA